MIIVRKLGQYLVTAWVAVTVTFILPRLMPGNPVQTLIGANTGQLDPQAIHSLELLYGIGLHQNLFAQYVTFLHQLAIGNLGFSITNQTSVTSILSGRILWTLGFVGTGTIVSFAVGTVSGALLGWFRGGVLDNTIPLATFFQAVPYFFLGLVLQLIFGTTLHWFPAEGNVNPAAIAGWNWDYIFSIFRYAQLPAITVIMTSTAGWLLGMRNMMITMIGEDFVLMAVAKGLPRRKVIMHAARNAVLPSMANLSLALGLVVSGALLVELVFSYPGVGNILLQAVLNEDYPLIQGMFLIITFTVLLANLLGDLLYFALDPRTRTEAVV